MSFTTEQAHQHRRETLRKLVSLGIVDVEGVEDSEEATLRVVCKGRLGEAFMVYGSKDEIRLLVPRDFMSLVPWESLRAFRAERDVLVLIGRTIMDDADVEIAIPMMPRLLDTLNEVCSIRVCVNHYKWMEPRATVYREGGEEERADEF